MFSKIFYENNFDNMLLRRHCVVYFYNSSGEIQKVKYAIEKGGYSTKLSNGTIVSTLTNPPYPIYTARHDDGYGNFRLNMNFKSIRYHQYLIRCRELFEMEIKNNVLSISESKNIKIYLHNIYNKYHSKLKDFKSKYEYELEIIKKGLSGYIIDKFFEDHEINFGDFDETSTLLNNLKYHYPTYFKFKANTSVPNRKNTTLIDIWNFKIGSDFDSYNYIISELIRNSFLESETLEWRLPEGRSWPLAHLKAFLYVLMNNKLIGKTHSGAELKYIIENTFNIKFNIKRNDFSSLFSKPPKNIYTDCFSFVALKRG